MKKISQEKTAELSPEGYEYVSPEEEAEIMEMLKDVDMDPSNFIYMGTFELNPVK